MNQTDLTPVEKHGDIFLKRDDLFEYAGVRGGKVRGCLHVIGDSKPKGLITAGSRHSPQINIVAHIAQAIGIPARLHCPMGELGAELKEAQKLGGEVIQHKAGYNNVICARAIQDAKDTGYLYIPFGMECKETVEATKGQVENLPLDEIERIVVPVGSGMTLAAILTGLQERNIKIPVVGIVVGADPIKRLQKYAPIFWQNMVTFVKADVDYSVAVEAKIDGVVLDPIYEAKASKFLMPRDLFWVIGRRNNVKEIYRCIGCGDDCTREQGTLNKATNKLLCFTCSRALK